MAGCSSAGRAVRSPGVSVAHPSHCRHRKATYRVEVVVLAHGRRVVVVGIVLLGLCDRHKLVQDRVVDARAEGGPVAPTAQIDLAVCGAVDAGPAHADDRLDLASIALPQPKPPSGCSVRGDPGGCGGSMVGGYLEAQMDDGVDGAPGPPRLRLPHQRAAHRAHC